MATCGRFAGQVFRCDPGEIQGRPDTKGDSRPGRPLYSVGGTMGEEGDKGAAETVHASRAGAIRRRLYLHQSNAGDGRWNVSPDGKQYGAACPADGRNTGAVTAGRPIDKGLVRRFWRTRNVLK